MNSALTPHPDDELLLRHLDGDLGPAENRSLDDHLSGCASCRQHLGEVRETLDDYRQFHQTILKAAVPPPPKAWDRLDLRSAVVRQARSSWFPIAGWRWLAAAAAIAAIFLLTRRLEKPPAVKAAELLRRAATIARTAPPRSRTIRITAGRYHLDRASRLTPSAEIPSPDAVQIRRLFDSAGYGWEDPLSADAFGRWRDRLPNKQDEVARGPESYVIHTATTANPISDASLTLRAADLQAIACTLRFASETVEMVELPGETVQPRAEAPGAADPAARPGPLTLPSSAATPGDELLVLAALHRIGADLGEPVEVRREGTEIVVNVAGLGQQRREQVKAALSGMPVVRLQLEQTDPTGSADLERRPSPQVDTADPLLSELQAASPDLPEQLTDHTEILISRAYALRGLARRFSPETTARMTASEIGTLHRIVHDHAGAMAASVTAAAQLLSPLLPRVVPEPALTDAWQQAAEALVLDARQLDQALHPATASVDTAARKLRAAQALTDMGERLPMLLKLQ
jgi:hypothetical protein